MIYAVVLTKVQQYRQVAVYSRVQPYSEADILVVAVGMIGLTFLLMHLMRII